MLPRQDWQTEDSNMYDGSKLFGYDVSERPVANGESHALDTPQHPPIPPWMLEIAGATGAAGSRAAPYPMGQPPNAPLANGDPGPSTYGIYHDYSQARYAPDLRPDLISPRLTGHFPRGEADGVASTPASAPAPLPKPKSRQSMSTTRNYSNGHVGPSLKRGMACGFCRRRKLRCDAERPACANCRKYRKECEYVHQPKTSDEEDADDRAHDATALPASHGMDPLGRTDSSSSAGENLVSPPNPPPFFDHSFPPRFGQNVLIPESIQPMGPPGLTPDAQPYAYNFPFTSASELASQPLSAPPHIPTFTPAPPQFTQFGTLGFPAWRDSPYGPIPDSSAPHTAPVNHVPLPDTFDVKPHMPASDTSTPVYPRYRTEEPPRTRQNTLQSVDSLRSLRSTPDPAEPPPPSMMVDPHTPYTYTIPPPKHNVLYTAADAIPHLTIDPVDGLTARLGEFLFAPSEPLDAPRRQREASTKRRKQSMSSNTEPGPPMGLVQSRMESDGLTNAARDQLLSIFLAHSRLFFEMSVPRFKYRMSFNDRRRPSLALLNAMYLWASRIAAAPGQSPLEEAFFAAGCRTLEASTSRADRLIDAMRAAMLLGTYAYTNGRHHEGFLLAGLGMRLVTSTGVHQIPSCTFHPPAPRNALLRQKTFLLPPPEDKLELAERIHTFWAVYMIERCGALATGFPSALRDEDVLTPFPRPMVDIASGNVTSSDDVTIRDLYRFSIPDVGDDSKVLKWLKALTIIERAAKLAFLDPTDDSDYAKAMSAHVMSHPSAPLPPPPAWMDQPKYRCPGEYRVIKFGLDQFVQSLGVEGIFPVDRRRNAEIDGADEPFISSHTIIVHHMLAAIYLFLHDINSIQCENTEALSGARKCVALFRYLPPIPTSDVDSFVVVIWGMVARTLLKEMHRLRLQGDTAGAKTAEGEADVIVNELNRVGQSMGLSKTQAMGLEALKAMDSRSFAVN